MTGCGDEAGTDFAPLRAVADALLYEGYQLHPCRESSPRNLVRRQSGVLAPRPWVERNGPVAAVVAGSVESWRQQTECVVEAREGDDVTLRARIRFLQTQGKSVERRGPGGRYTGVESLDVDGTRHLSFDEAVPHEADLVVPFGDLVDGFTAGIGAPGGEETSALGAVGRVVRRRWPLEAVARLRAEPVEGQDGVYRLRVRIENTNTAIGPGASRAVALRQALIATHILLGGCGLRFVSLLKPPEWARRPVAACQNIHTFPVLAGPYGSREHLLSAPIPLYDYPQSTPCSGGDRRDATEPLPV
ncbi:hypothetical protein FNH05_12060 [Amycolatopsis rhizosphaerae]|uniref:Uncharacterized protein n=1 Tax=Amycolatopsis rhizosphaerae TaxID=2053003 RepID=A0A558CWZ8_9PSEU|nr:hypothetical protein [Amycolatopsis rhizosphaerae]TVT53290.1 hypothetical protein FNH05_12060 [Amycolatopsis rhizosphaerae]